MKLPRLQTKATYVQYGYRSHDHSLSPLLYNNIILWLYIKYLYITKPQSKTDSNGEIFRFHHIPAHWTVSTEVTLALCNRPSLCATVIQLLHQEITDWHKQHGTVKLCDPWHVVPVPPLGALQRRRKIRDFYGSGWVGPGLAVIFFFKPSQNSPKPGLIFWSSVPCVYIAKSCWLL